MDDDKKQIDGDDIYVKIGQGKDDIRQVDDDIFFISTKNAIQGFVLTYELSPGNQHNTDGMFVNIFVSVHMGGHLKCSSV